ncbi:MAG: DUF2459 domain-containing protein [Ignavibacteriaceae bacterium]
MKFLTVLLIIIFTEVYSPASEEGGTQFIYLVKQHWHTGIVFEINSIDTAEWKEIKDFKNFKYVDVGWGDEEFYQYPGDFDIGLAVKAIGYPTASALRIEGFNFEADKYAELSDYTIRIPVTGEQLHTLYKYVSDAYFKNKNGDTEILSERYSGNIKFYRANDKYHLFNTCNTWIAKGLEKAGFKINPSLVILAQDLFLQAERFGTVLKSDEKSN